MTKKENIENMARIIANRVRYHAPIVYDNEIDTSILTDFGIDISMPIFKFEKEMTKPLEKAFALAKKLQNFNLVTTQKSKCPFALFLPKETVNLRLLQSVNKLNINYKTSSNYNPKFEMDYVKINGKILNLKYNDFCLEKHESFDGVLVHEKLFFCSGKIVAIELQNSNPYESEIVLSVNKNLECGQYYFKKERHSIRICNLFTREERYFNTNLPLAKTYFSCVDGVESSSYACVKLNEKIKLKPYQKKFVFLHFGNRQFYIKNTQEMEVLFGFSKQKCYKNFDAKVYSTDKTFDEKINTILPRNIWLAWLDDKRDLTCEKEYIEEKEKLFIRRDKKIIFNNFGYEKLREIDIFDGKDFREIYIKNLSKENSLVIGGTHYQNMRTFSFENIKSKTQICLHFR